MRGWPACALVALVACGSDKPGLYVDAIAPGATEVTAYIGEQPCMKSGSACTRLAPQGFTGKVDTGSGGGIWYRDRPDTDFTASVVGGHARLLIEASADDQTVQIVLVASGPNGPTGVAVLQNVEVPPSRAIDVKATLVPAMPAAESIESTAPASGDYVAVWPPDAPTCVMAEHWDGGTATRTFVVRSDDSDCDGFADDDRQNECDPFFFDYPGGSPPLSASDCASPGPVNGHTACVLSGPTCIDGLGAQTNACDPITSSSYCLPMDLCAMPCAQPPPTGGPLDSCLNNGTASGAAFPAFHCTIYIDPSGQPCNLTAQDGLLDATTLVGVAGKSCSDILIADDSLSQLNADNHFTLGSAELDIVRANSAGCSFSLVWQGMFDTAGQWSGGTIAPITDGDPVWKLTDLAVDDDHHLLVPTRFTTSDCTSYQPGAPEIDCYSVGFGPTNPNPIDSITDCAR